MVPATVADGHRLETRIGVTAAPPDEFQMKKQKFKYVGDAAFKRFLQEHDCPTPFHVVRMRFLGEIASPDFAASPMKTVESFWPDGLPEFENEGQMKPFVETFLGLWNRMSRHQDGVLVKLVKPRKLRVWSDVAATLRMRGEEIGDGFLLGFRGGGQPQFLPEEVEDSLSGLEKIAEQFEKAAAGIKSPAGDEDGFSLGEYRYLIEDRTKMIEGLLTTLVKISAQIRKASIEASMELDDETPLH